jgi:FkbM family methyltransferase
MYGRVRRGRADDREPSEGPAAIAREPRSFAAGHGPAFKQRLQGWLRELGYDVKGVRHTPRQLLDPALGRALEFDDVICRHMFEHEPACVFVQVGAYDGVSTDPLHKYIARCGWRGVMLEPQPLPASQLRSLYAETPGVRVVEAAVDHERGWRSLYTVEGGDELPQWVGSVASFDRAHVARHEAFAPGIAAKIRELKVGCVTFDDVLGWLPDGRLDLLQIDAEGADAYLLSLFPFERVRPAIVQWEVHHLTRAEQEGALERLCGLGYRVCRSGDADMLAIA